MSDHITAVNAFHHAYWHDDTEALGRLIHPDFRWDNVPFHAFRLENGDIVTDRTMIRHGVETLGSRSSMVFRDAKTGEIVSQDEGTGGHEVVNEVELPNGTVIQERIDLTGLRGAIVRMRCVGIFEFTDDLIAEWRDNFEINHWLGQLAVLGLEYAGYATDRSK